MEEVLNCHLLPIALRCCSSLSKAIQEIEIEIPDMIMIGSGMLLWNGLEVVKNRILIPTVILCEGEGFEVLLKEDVSNVLHLTRPFDLDEIPLMLQKAVELCSIHKEKLKCT
jgi:hypothetical protein